jgi:hypothetical protein
MILPDANLLLYAYDQSSPFHPKAAAWCGYGDWLGTGNVSNRLRRFRSFDSAGDFARSLGLTSQTEWRVFCKGLLPEKGRKPTDIPQSPQRTYANKGWSGYGDWLGTNRTRVSKSPKRKS